METTVTLSQSLGIPLLDIFDHEMDEVIMLVNFYIEKGEKGDANEAPAPRPKKDSFWDF